jgi:hypothetical protein
MWPCGLGEDDGVAGSRTARVQWLRGLWDVTGWRRRMTLWAHGRCGSTVPRVREWCRVHNIVGSGRTMLLQAKEWCRGLGDNAWVVDGITGSGRGRWRPIKGLDCDREWRCRDSWEDTTMTPRLRGGLDDSTGSEEVNDSAGSREIFGGKFC